MHSDARHTTRLCAAIKAKMQSKPRTWMELKGFHRPLNINDLLINRLERKYTGCTETRAQNAFGDCVLAECLHA